MLHQRGEGIVIARLVAPIENGPVETDQLPTAQFKVRHQGGGGAAGGDHQNEGAFVAHEGMVDGAGEIRAGHQRHGIDR